MITPSRLQAREIQTLEAGFRQLYTPPGAVPLPPPDQPSHLATLKKGQRVAPRQVRVTCHPPPPRRAMSEAELIRALRTHRIGRPATYASILQTLFDREYAIALEGGKLCTTSRGQAVCTYLVDTYPFLTDYGFTAEMEAHLDDLAQGRRGYVETVQALWQVLPHDLPRKETPKK